MELLYIISTIILLLSFILIKKTEKKIDITGFIVISIVLLFAYNTFVSYILTFFTIPIKLWILGMINLFISLILIICIGKKNKIQEYTFDVIDLLYIPIIIILILIISYANFGFPAKVKYEAGGDSSIHFLAAYRSAKYDSLMPGIEEKDQVYGTLSNFKPGAYINNALLIKCFSDKIDTLECYTIFVSFKIIVLMLTGINIYTALKKFAKNRYHVFLAFLISVISTLGYPLNSFLFGFEYLSMSLLVTCTIIDLIYYYENCEFKFIYIIIIFGLLNLQLFLSYYMFVPVVFSALWIYFCINHYYATKKIITKKLIALLVITLLLPFILGYIYCFTQDIYLQIINKNLDITKDSITAVSESILNSGFMNEGYIYVNLYSNFILLLPLTIYFFIKEIRINKLKNNNFIMLLFVFFIMFILLLLLGNKFERVSMYYLSKNYFALWIVLAFTNYKALILLSKKNKLLSNIFIILYVILIIACIIFSNVTVRSNIPTNADENILEVMDIFATNKAIMLNNRDDFNQKELEILRYVKENLDYNSKIEVGSNDNAYYWAYVLLEHIDKEDIYVCGRAR